MVVVKPCAVRLTATQRELSLRLTMPREEGNKVNKPHRQQTLETLEIRWPQRE